MKKFADQYYVQTWHGDRGYKRIALDAHPDQPERYPDNKYMDLALAGSTFARDISFRRAMRYEGEILLSGVAKNDILIHPPVGVCERVRKNLGIEKDEKVLLYAPTFRKKNQNNQAIDVDLAEVIRHLEARDGCEWVCLVRAHPSARFAVDCSGGGTVDVTDYPDMADLLLVADFLITDYSSCASDFALTRRPIILATFDRDSYSQEERSLNVALEDTGFIYADSQARLIEIIDSSGDTDYRESCERVLRFYGSAETGHAAERICSMIEEKYRQLSAC
jgi:CDP-glycerol glycerophosphotransferase